MSIRSCLNTIVLMFSIFLLTAYAEKKACAEEMEPKALFEKRCSRCHSLNKTDRNESADYWKATVQKMKKKFFSGIKDEDVPVITEYLIKTKGLPESTPTPTPDKTPDK